MIGFLLFSLSWRELLALAIAVLVHETGHLIAMRIADVHSEGIRLSISGPVILCQDVFSAWKSVFIALSGPAAGILFWLMMVGRWTFCADISLVLALVNLLPVPPLDGGKAAFAMIPKRFVRILDVIRVALPSAIMLFGLTQISSGTYGIGLVAFGAWLLILTCQEP